MVSMIAVHSQLGRNSMPTQRRDRRPGYSPVASLLSRSRSVGSSNRHVYIRFMLHGTILCTRHTKTEFPENQEVTACVIIAHDSLFSSMHSVARLWQSIPRTPSGNGTVCKPMKRLPTTNWVSGILYIATRLEWNKLWRKMIHELAFSYTQNFLVLV